MWAFGRYDLGLSEEGLLSLTMREYYALAKRCREVRRWSDSQTALLCAVVVNMLQDPKNPRKKVTDFMPGIPKRKQTVQEMMAVAKRLTLAHGGEVKNGLR